MKGKLQHTSRGFQGAEMWSCFYITKALILIVSLLCLLSKQRFSPEYSHSTDNTPWFWFCFLTLKFRHQDVSIFLQIPPFPYRSEGAQTQPSTEIETSFHSYPVISLPPPSLYEGLFSFYFPHLCIMLNSNSNISNSNSPTSLNYGR